MLLLDSFNLEAGERALCAEALRCGSLSGAAMLLGISSLALRRRMAKYGLRFDRAERAMMTSKALAFGAATLRALARSGLDVRDYAAHATLYRDVARSIPLVRPTIPGAVDLARGLVASVHAQALDAEDLLRLARLIRRRSPAAVEYIDAVRWSTTESEEAAIRAKLGRLRRKRWTVIYESLARVDARLARRLRLRHCFLRDVTRRTP